MSPERTIGVGVIGLGMRGLQCLGRHIASLAGETGFRITALCDRSPERLIEARDLLQLIYSDQDIPFEPSLYPQGQDLIAAPEVQLVLITTPTDTHRTFAVPALQSGKHVYCDKPLAQNAAESVAIVEAEAAAGNPLIMGFTRRYEVAWRRAYSLLQEGAIGRLTMIQVRDVIPYHRYLTAWWRRRAWSGGALNDKGCHLFDVLNWFARSRALKVHGFGGRSVVEPDPDAPRRCTECERECPYRRRPFQGTQGPVAHVGQSWAQETEERYMDDVCVYAPGSDIYHNASIHFAYENGVLASYFYTIFGPRAEDQETIELVGSEGRIRLIRGTGMLDVVRERGLEHEVIDCKDERFYSSHFGADVELVRELRRFCDGAQPVATARDGLEATRMVEGALRSMDKGGVTVDMNTVPDVRIVR